MTCQIDYPITNRGEWEKWLLFVAQEYEKTKIDYLLASVKNDKRPYLNVTILQRDFLGLVDTGASKTIINFELGELLHTMGFKLNSSRTKFVGTANGGNCEVLGCIDIPFCLKNKIVLINTLVVKELTPGFSNTS